MEKTCQTLEKCQPLKKPVWVLEMSDTANNKASAQPKKTSNESKESKERVVNPMTMIPEGVNISRGPVLPVKVNMLKKLFGF